MVGAFAETPRYQGAGSSQVNPTRLDTVLDALRARLGDATELTYAPGYDPLTGATDPGRCVAEALARRRGADAVVLCAGLPAAMESEGFDRTTLDLPDGHATSSRPSRPNPAGRRRAQQRRAGRTCRGPTGSPRCSSAGSAAQAGGRRHRRRALRRRRARRPPGRELPGRVAELPAHRNFPGHPTQVQYRESLYVGYRFHDTSGVAPRFAFGHGLGYTTFESSDLARRRVRHRPDRRRRGHQHRRRAPAPRSCSSTCTTPTRPCTDPSRS